MYSAAAAAAAKSLQSCLTLWDPIDRSPPGSPIPGILQARTLEWAAISFSNAWKWKVKGRSLSCGGFLVTPWTTAYQAPPSMGFSRQEDWSGVPLPSLECPSEWVPNRHENVHWHWFHAKHVNHVIGIPIDLNSVKSRVIILMLYFRWQVWSEGRDPRDRF